MTVLTTADIGIEFPCFGSSAALSVRGGRNPHGTLAEARARMEDWHRRLTRFDTASELSRLNASRDVRVPASYVMCRFVASAIHAAEQTLGLVDPTLVDEIEAAGYAGDLNGSLDLETTLALAPPRRPARAAPSGRWRDVTVDWGRRAVVRSPSVKLDSGGIAKGLAADVLAERLANLDAFAVDCAGDVRVGGRLGLPRAVQVDDPFERGVLTEFGVVDAGVATSGIGRRSWFDQTGRVAHHLLDPSTGQPAFTGIVQATALAPTAMRAEMLAKAALLSGPGAAPDWLLHGGVLVFDDGTVMLCDPRGVDVQ